MDGEIQNETTPPPTLRERIGRRAWVRSVALVGGGLIAGGIIAGTVTANAADEGPTTPDSSTTREEGPRGDRHGHGPRGNGDPSQPQRSDEELLTVLVDEDFEITGTEEHGD